MITLRSGRLTWSFFVWEGAKMLPEGSALAALQNASSHSSTSSTLTSKRQILTAQKSYRDPNHAKHEGLWPSQVTRDGSILCVQFPWRSGLARVSWVSQEHSLPAVHADEAMDTSNIWQSGQRTGGLLWNRWRITLHCHIQYFHGCKNFHAISVNDCSGKFFYHFFRSCKVQSTEPWRTLPHPVRKWKQLMDRSCKLAILLLAMLPGWV